MPNEDDLDRAAILARRRRFIALAISGLATAGCKRTSPEACLSIEITPQPEDEPEPPQPFVEDPGVPLRGETGPNESETGSTEGEALEHNRPQVCLEVAPKPKSPKPRPCLKKQPPQPCLMIL